MAYINL